MEVLGREAWLLGTKHRMSLQERQAQSCLCYLIDQGSLQEV